MLRTFPRQIASWLGWNSPGRPALSSAAAARITTPLSDRDMGTAVELFARLAEITATVRTDVKEHSGSIDAVNTELAAIPQGDIAAVAAAVCKLVVINQQTQQRLAQAELRLQAQQRQLNDVAVAANSDGLTGLLNRRALDEKLRTGIAEFQRQARPMSLLLLDVDHFKRFNDTHGHVAGDQALKILADVLLAHSRESDLVVRFGGEEFAVVFAGAKAGAVLQRAEAMRLAISQAPVLYEGRTLHVTASAGLTELQSDDDAASLLKRADEALYAAKLDGRNCAYWHEGDRLQQIGAPLTCAPSILEAVESPADATLPEGVELAAEQFADATFLSQVSRRIAEWRRGGATFSVVLARVDLVAADGSSISDDARRTALRIAYQFARASLRDMDLLTRWNEGGFAILLPGSLVTDAAGVAGRLRAAVQRCEMPAPHAHVKLSLAAGVAEVIEANDAQRVLRRAWLALDAARTNGTGTVYLHDGLRPVVAASSPSTGKA